jgi:hypothetical protein
MTASAFCPPLAVVPLALSDDDRAVDGQAVQRLAHRVDRGFVRSFFITPAGQARGGQRGGLRHAHGFQRQVAIHREALVVGRNMGIGMNNRICGHAFLDSQDEELGIIGLNREGNNEKRFIASSPLPGGGCSDGDP